MTPLEAIRRRLEAATPGPWEARHCHVHGTPASDELGGLGWEVEGPSEPMLRGQFARAADAQFIAHAREDVALLLAVAEAAHQWVCCSHEDGSASWIRLEEAVRRLTEEVPA